MRSLLLVATIAALSSQNQMDLMMTLTGEYIGCEYGASIVSMDFIGDDFEDFAASDNHYAGNSGQGGIWLGKQDMNGTRDLSIDPPDSYSYRNFGWSKAAGDFNGDGYVDVAFSAPIWTQGHTWNTAGKVFIYAGNAELNDTTVSHEDELAVPVAHSISVAPNPFRELAVISYELAQKSEIELKIYNIRGQLVKQLYRGTQTKGEQHLAWEGCDDDARYLPAGVYLLQMRANGKISKTLKMLKL